MVLGIEARQFAKEHPVSALMVLCIECLHVSALWLTMNVIMHDIGQCVRCTSEYNLCIYLIEHCSIALQCIDLWFLKKNLFTNRSHVMAATVWIAN